MTRLNTEDIKDIVGQLDHYDMDLFQKTGNTLRGIASHAMSIPERTLQAIAGTVEVGIVPIQSGQGIIEGFSKTVKRIVQYIGFKTFLTKKTDVAGIAEAVEKNAEVIMMADDHRYIALNVRSNRMSDNAAATAKGYVAGLDLMVGGLEGKKVLVIGCGPVGRNAALAALQRGAKVSVFDIDKKTCHSLAKEIYKAMKKRINIETDFDTAMQHNNLIVEATNAPGIIDMHYIYSSTYIAAPGMPLGLTPSAKAKVSQRLIHDPLQIGTAVMAVDAVMSRSIEEWRVMLPYGSYIAHAMEANPKGKTRKVIKESPKTPTPPPNQSQPQPQPPPPTDLPEEPEPDEHGKTEEL